MRHQIQVSTGQPPTHWCQKKKKKSFRDQEKIQNKSTGRKLSISINFRRIYKFGCTKIPQ